MIACLCFSYLSLPMLELFGYDSLHGIMSLVLLVLIIEPSIESFACYQSFFFYFFSCASLFEIRSFSKTLVF
jgi:hypothetical protein